LNGLAVAIVLLFVLKNLAGYGQQYLMVWVGQRAVMDLRVALYGKIQSLSLTYLHKRRVGELLSRITGDVATLQGLVSTTIVDLVVQTLTFFGMAGFLIYLNWKLTVFALFVIPIAFKVIHFASQRLRAVGHTIQQELASLSAIAYEALSAIRIVRSFATEEQELARFRRQGEANVRALVHGTQIQATLQGVVEVILIVALALLLWVGGREVIAGSMTPGELIAFLGYLGFMVQPLRVISRIVGSLQQCLASADRIFEILEVPEVLPAPARPVFLKPVRGEISFEDVWFAYEPGRWILKGVSLSIRPGERIAVVGSTGAGKTTLADLVPRFYDPQRGAVKIDGVDVRELDLKSLRKQIGIVPQDPVLLKGTMAYNIAYGFEEASPEAIREAAKTAGIADFIESLPAGYETEVGERGVTLSGGQRQRIAIARAIVRDPRILILDEATSSLDTAVEHQIQQAMGLAMKGRTSLVIAHRLSTILESDRILVIDDGRIVEAGTHESLLSAQGLYARLYGLQFRESAGS
ncbi:MAG: ABC transporter ATP-binding protein, partial [Synergistaceae bacterium]|nr:ABC transporter ATP-binding protein [Synergistaceae bacterium]